MYSRYTSPLNFKEQSEEQCLFLTFTLQTDSLGKVLRAGPAGVGLHQLKGAFDINFEPTITHLGDSADWVTV